MQIKGWDIAFGGEGSVAQCTQRFGDYIVAVRMQHVEFVYAAYHKRVSVLKLPTHFNNLAQTFAEHLSDVEISTKKIKKLLTQLEKIAILYNVKLTLH